MSSAFQWECSGQTLGQCNPCFGPYIMESLMTQFQLGCHAAANSTICLQVSAGPLWVTRKGPPFPWTTIISNAVGGNEGDGFLPSCVMTMELTLSRATWCTISFGLLERPENVSFWVPLLCLIAVYCSLFYGFLKRLFVGLIVFYYAFTT